MGTWRKAYGALKDSTKVGLAKVNSEFKVRSFSSQSSFASQNKSHFWSPFESDLAFGYDCRSRIWTLRSSRPRTTLNAPPRNVTWEVSIFFPSNFGIFWIICWKFALFLVLAWIIWRKFAGNLVCAANLVKFGICALCFDIILGNSGLMGVELL